MKILGLTDMVIKEEQLGKALKETFPGAEVRYLGGRRRPGMYFPKKT